jgi:hypothetical protein
MHVIHGSRRTGTGEVRSESRAMQKGLVCQRSVGGARYSVVDKTYLHVTTGLAHHPDRRPLHGIPAEGPEH